jgi:hypothetical protein
MVALACVYHGLRGSRRREVPPRIAVAAAYDTLTRAATETAVQSDEVVPGG